MRFPWQQTGHEREVRGEIRSLRLGRAGNPRLASLAATKTAALKAELEDKRRTPAEKTAALAREYLATGSGAAYAKLREGGHLPGLAPGRRPEASADREAEAGA